MLTNDQMVRNRFGKWHNAKKLVEMITSNLKAGNVVIISTYTKHVQYSKKHADMFKATKSGAYVQRGKYWDCIDGCAVRCYKKG